VATNEQLADAKARITALEKIKVDGEFLVQRLQHELSETGAAAEDDAEKYATELQELRGQHAAEVQTLQGQIATLRQDTSGQVQQLQQELEAARAAAADEENRHDCAMTAKELNHKTEIDAIRRDNNDRLYELQQQLTHHESSEETQRRKMAAFAQKLPRQ